jgi:hypothetical protein
MGGNVAQPIGKAHEQKELVNMHSTEREEQSETHQSGHDEHTDET